MRLRGILHSTVFHTDFRVGRYLFRSEYAVQADGSLMPLRSVLQLLV